MEADIAPDPKIDITYKGDPKTVFMSYLRLNSCLRVVGGMDRMSAMMIDPDIGENIVRVLVAPKGGVAEMFSVELDDEDISVADFDRLLEFARGHLTAFFLKRLQSAAKNVGDLESAIAVLKSSAGGLETSSSSGASAGPSA